MFTQEINQLWVKLIIIGVAMCVIPPFIYIGIVYFLQQSPNYSVKIDYPTLKILNYCLMGISVLGILPGLYFLKGRFLNYFLQDGVTNIPQEEKTFNRIIPPGIMMRQIILCGLCEAIAIFGLLYGILGGNFFHVIAYEAISLAFFIRFSFKKHEVENMAFSLAEKHNLIQE